MKSKQVFFCCFVLTTSSLAKFKPNAFAVLLRGWVYDLLKRSTTGERPGCIYISVFHLSSDIISFLSPVVQIYWAAFFRDPVEYNIKPQGGEKTCRALK